ncbi:MAG: hypothetical protein KGY61_09945 [Desulfobacterales bacterium]|nr:hypothetical protein [Desulfobacterales bacterium]
MIRFVTMTFPASSAKETMDTFLNLPKAPDFVTHMGPWVSGMAEDRVKTVSIFEFDSSKEKEASDYIKGRYDSFLGVPEININIEEWISVDEAVKTLES